MANLGAWPPAVPAGLAASFLKEPTTATITWGTDGLYSSYIVKSARFTQRAEEIDIENGSGFEAVVFLILKGEQVEFTVIDDTSVSITPPQVGDVVAFTTPFTASLNLWVTANEVTGARKEPGERVFTAKSFKAITLA